MSAATSLFGGSLLAQPVVSLLNSISVFGTDLLSGFFWQAVIVLLYWAWLIRLVAAPQAAGGEGSKCFVTVTSDH